MRTVLNDTPGMNAVAVPSLTTPLPAEAVALSTLHPGARGVVVRVGSLSGTVSPLERRLMELGFVNGEQIEILAETRPGRDPFVVRVGQTTLALRRREAETVWIELT